MDAEAVIRSKTNKWITDQDELSIVFKRGDSLGAPYEDATAKKSTQDGLTVWRSHLKTARPSNSRRRALKAKTLWASFLFMASWDSGPRFSPRTSSSWT